MGMQTRICVLAVFVLVTIAIIFWDRSNNSNRAAQPSADAGSLREGGVPKNPGTADLGPAGSSAKGARPPSAAEETAAAKGGAREDTFGPDEPEGGPDTVFLETGGAAEVAKGGAGRPPGPGKTHGGLPSEGASKVGAHAPDEGAKAAPATEEKGSSYTVQPGDSPWKIAQKVYKDGTKFHLILDANKDVIIDPNNLKVGTQLAIPAANGTVPGPAAAAQAQVPEQGKKGPEEPATPPKGGGGQVQEYTIQSGDTLSAISEKFYGTSNRWQEIYEANTDRLESPNRLVVGLTITIPAEK